MGSIGPYELILPVIIILFLIFGAKKIPELARSLGKAIVEFRKGINQTDQPRDKETKNEHKIENGSKE